MAYTWDRPVVNGGFCNVVCAGTREGEFYCGGDMYGPSRSEDGGRSWIPTMWGGSSIGDTYGRAVAPSLKNPGTGYYGCATLKAGGGAFTVTQGFKMERRSKAVGFGIGLGAGAGGTLPRPVGSKIDVLLNGTTETIWAASNKGLAVSTDQGRSWRVVAPQAMEFRSVVALAPDSALACLWNRPGLTLVQGGRVSHPTAPTIHELRTINGSVFAAGPGGIYHWDGGRMQPLFAGVFAGTRPTSIDGVGQVLVVGCDTPGQKCAALSRDGGKTWQWLGGRQKMQLEDGRPYWLRTATNGFAGKNYSVSQVAVDKVNPDNVLFAGRSGIWGSHDGCQTIYPLGPGGGEVSAVKAGPGADQFGGNDNDWTGIVTTDGWRTMNRSMSAPGGNGGLTVSVGGHTYKVTKGSTCAITRDGQSIGDDYFRGAACLAKCVGANGKGMVVVGLYGGGVLVGRP